MLIDRKTLGQHDISVRAVGGRKYLAIGDGGNVVGICRLADDEGQAARQIERAICRLQDETITVSVGMEGV